MVGLVLAAAALPLAALGNAEDPQERLTKVFTLDKVTSLEIRGQIDFQLEPGPRASIKVETNRALFDQLTVSNWWGAATLAIESGLRGPRERGIVKAVITLPSLRDLTVLDRSVGDVTWPSGAGLLKLGEESRVKLLSGLKNLVVEASWRSQLTLGGDFDNLTVTLRHESHVDATASRVVRSTLFLDESSVFLAGSTQDGRGTVRHKSQVSTLDPEAWKALVLREDSELVQSSKSTATD